MGSRFGSLAFAVTLAVASVGCEKKIVTVTLTPSQVLTTDKHAGDFGDTCASGCLSKMGQSCAAKGFMMNPDYPNSTLVGFHNSYDAGTEPCPCWEWGDCIWRSYIKFDMSALPNSDVVGAQLRWNSRTNVAENGVAINEGNCAAKMFIATEAWGNYAIAGDEVIGTNFTGSLELGTPVRQWAQGTKANYGVFFVGPNETMTAKSGDECRTQLSHFELTVQVAEPK